MSDRAELQMKLDRAIAEFNHAGPIHRKDLQRCIRRLSREIRDYDRFHAMAGKKMISS